MTKAQTRRLLIEGEKKNPQLWGCLYELSTVNGAVFLDQFAYIPGDRGSAKVQTKSQVGTGKRSHHFNFTGSLN